MAKRKISTSNKKLTNKELIALQQESKKELARRIFWCYAQLKAPDFYKKDRAYLKTLCYTLQDFIDSDKKVLLVNIPPRHGKSRTLQVFIEWLLGNNPTLKIMTGSYNETLSTNFSKAVRNSIQELKAEDSKLVFSDFFPSIEIAKGDGAINLWSLNKGFNNYLATSPTGTATGFGADIILIDDIIKNAEEAYNELTKLKHWQWFTNTMLSRLEEGGKIIIVMTRWATDDLAGRCLQHFRQEQLTQVTMKALQDDGTMLCDSILSYESNEDKKKVMDLDIWTANYQQEPIDIKGRLYTHFKTYEHIPQDANHNPLFESIRNYTDTADTGSDFLCSITYGVYQKQAYVLDVFFSKKPMEYTEPETAKRLHDYKVTIADIESNNGGRGFARSIERILRQDYKDNRTDIRPFHQSKNKQARILSSSTWCMNNIYFPINWIERYPEFSNALLTYQKEGKNAHDDAPDALAGIYDKLTAGESLVSFF